jgi:hypothetical protein
MQTSHPPAAKQPNTYRPAIRQLDAHVLTPAGWMKGTIMLPQSQSLADHLSKTSSIMKLAAVRLPGRPEPIPFFALQCAAAVLVAPAQDDRIESEHTGVLRAPLSVTFLMEAGTLTGSVAFQASLRLSDFLRQQTGFVLVREAVWTPHTAAATPGRTARRYDLPCVLVNAPLIIGVAEAEDDRHED